MVSNRILRVILISFILVLVSLLPTVMITSLIKADPVAEETTFYFKDALNLEGTSEYDSMFGMSVLVSQELPTKQNDSEYPPDLFDGFKLNSEEWLIWFTTSWIFYFFDESLLGEENSGYEELFEGLEILLPHPFRITEIYEHKVDEPFEIDGNVVFDLFFFSDNEFKI